MMFDTVSLSSSDDDVPLKSLGVDDEDVPLKKLATNNDIPTTTAANDNLMKSLANNDDDIPLKTLKDKDMLKPSDASYVPIKSAALKTKSLEQCDFCEEVFLNKYDALIHNGKHIIIPLIKKDLHQCPLCLFYFTSRYKLKHHTRNKHKNEVKDDVNLNPVVTENKAHVKPISANKIIIKPIPKDNKTGNKPVIIAVKPDKHNESKEINKNVANYKFDEKDDLPLLNSSKFEIKETEILKQSLLKDVKVVIEKINIPDKPKMSNSALKVPDVVKIDIEDQKMSKPLIPKTSLDTVNVPEFDTKASNQNSKQHEDNGKVKIRNRLTFEEEIDDICDDEVMKDLTKDCIVDLNLFNGSWFDELIGNEITKSIANDANCDNDAEVISIDDDDDLEESQNQEACTNKEEEDIFTPSTHHDELIKPGLYICRKCQQMFPTRFNQIQHEMTHMHIRKPRPVLCEFCDRFLANKKALKDHITSKHRMHYRPKTFQNCTKCGLKYNNYDTHMENYHVICRCHLCNQGFQTEIDRLNHIRGHLVKIKCNQCEFVASEIEIQEHQKRFHKVSLSVATVYNLCEVCCLFLKNRGYTQYVFGESVSELGSRLDCHHCGNKFFHLTKVRRIIKGRPIDRFTSEKERDKKKVLTNKDRLKNIQQRLKMINRLSRF